MDATATGTTEHFAFQAEVDRLLDLVVNSLYSNREVFVRELVSNASDALDKLRFEALTNEALSSDKTPYEIRIIPDPEAGTLTIEDTGIGMTRDQLISDLGTIARSGTKAFAEQLAAAQEASSDSRLIGQFGVGFYSAYLVADRVDVISRSANSEEAWHWSSDAKGGFNVEAAERLERGTTLILHLKEDEKKYAEEWTLRELVKRYSDFVSHSIKLRVKATPPPAADDDSDDAPETTPEPTTTFETINKGTPLWVRSKADIEESEYKEFYRHVSHDWEEPAGWTHFKVEGAQQFTGLLYLPSRPPFDLFMPEQRRGVRLYVKRVFVMDECEEIVPQWLRFVRGIVDSDDLPLNVSREILQDSAVTRALRKSVIKKTLDRITELAKEDNEAYEKFWEQFGAVLKEGVHDTGKEKDKLIELLRYRSNTEAGWTSLDGYVERMDADQPAIYFITGRSKEALAGSPHLEGLKKKGYEVLLMTDIVDEWAVEAVSEYKGKKLVSALKAELSFGSDEEGEEKEDNKALDGLLEKAKGVLGDRVADVKVSDRLTDSPSCLVVPDGAMSAQMEQLMRAHNRELPSAKRILELNPTHRIVRHLQTQLDGGASDDSLKDWIEVLYEQAQLTEGSPLDNPFEFSKRLTRLLESTIAA